MNLILKINVITSPFLPSVREIVDVVDLCVLKSCTIS